jgi:hypothetical protein
MPTFWRPRHVSIDPKPEHSPYSAYVAQKELVLARIPGENREKPAEIVVKMPENAM